MYNQTQRYYGGYSYGGNCGCCCTPEIPNGYAFPAPIARQQQLLDTTQVTIHKDINITDTCVDRGCCGAEPVKVKTEKKSLVLSVCAECLEPSTYYTLNIDREIPPEAFPLDTYINVEPRGFYRGEVGLVKSEVEHFVSPAGVGKLFDTNRDNLASIEIDGENTYARGEDGGVNGLGYGYGGVPVDPAFPAHGGCGFRPSPKGVLIPVTLDLHGNIATGRNFTTGRFPANGYRPYNNKYTLFLNNRGEFSLCRPLARRSDYA